jgi:hypothetical protein
VVALLALAAGSAGLIAFIRSASPDIPESAPVVAEDFTYGNGEVPLHSDRDMTTVVRDGQLVIDVRSPGLYVVPLQIPTADVVYVRADITLLETGDPSDGAGFLVEAVDDTAYVVDMSEAAGVVVYSGPKNGELTPIIETEGMDASGTRTVEFSVTTGEPSKVAVKSGIRASSTQSSPSGPYNTLWLTVWASSSDVTAAFDNVEVRTQ